MYHLQDACRVRGEKSSVEWRGARLGIVALAVGALTASVLEAQEVSRERDGSTEEGGLPDVLVGMRGELVGLFSPGANLDVVVRFPDTAAWVSMGLLAQMIRWNVQYDHRTRRDHQYLGRVRLALGQGEGPIIYGLVEYGTGVIKTEPESMRGDTYNVTGLGLGVGWTVRRMTISTEAAVGSEDRADPSARISLGVSFQYRILPADSS